MDRFRPFTLDDARLVADLETARNPDEPRDAPTVAYWWTHPPEGERCMRLVSERDGIINVLLEAGHEAWPEGQRRFGWVGMTVHPDDWTERLYRDGFARAESWQRSEDAEVAVTTLREDFERERAVLAALGYREVRRERFWELDLLSRRDELLAGAEKTRAEMRRQGVTLTTLDRDGSAETVRKVYELDISTTQDVPTTVPFHVPNFEEWQRDYFENPGIRMDRFWIARVGDEVAGMSLIEFPPERGVPSTEFTGTSAKFRGRGIARALKYETVAQAIAIGATRIRTDNDSANAPILHINADMGYEPITPYLELHHEL